MAAAMLPGTFVARRLAARTTPALLAALTAFQGGAVVVLCALCPAPVATLAVLAAMAFVNGSRSMVGSALGMDAAPRDRVAAMSMRAAANQFGYLFGAARRRHGAGRCRLRRPRHPVRVHVHRRR